MKFLNMLLFTTSLLFYFCITKNIYVYIYIFSKVLTHYCAWGPENAQRPFINAYDPAVNSSSYIHSRRTTML